MFSLDVFSALFACIMSALVQESAVLGSWFCPVCDLCVPYKHMAFHSPGQKIVSLRSHWIDWLDKPIMGGWKVGLHFFHVVCRFRLILAFFEQKVPKTWRRNGPIKKINTIFGLTTHKFPCGYKFLFIIWEENFWHLKNIAPSLLT